MPRLPLIAAATIFSLWAPTVMAENHDEMTTLAETARDTDGYQTFHDAAERAGLIEMLTDEGPFTILAPTDAAFDNIDTDASNVLTDENTDALKALLMAHLIDGVLTKDELRAETEVTTLDGSTYTVEVDEGGEEIRIGDARVITADVAATNGTIHAIDTVLSGNGD
ncbi:Immunogenic protein MPT70 precursor [Rhodobacteraceae bacterium THAF1]|uniref:fasciclin domain-containing protein n=1 Tax=Palleronia sp. THAF1 TaxID=2587842 RepID=UPI000F3BBCF1|nr:fasciclin domain-containing protein [Palleronia sp. THAF1]QFU08663.1 Immunogenic protein MPT70 precursor [Palleronia sp. THAF1]VDC28410.1 Immunogenic protein MPT70 precursor [Rhodobacteraceae bacterium THAF1]